MDLEAQLSPTAAVELPAPELHEAVINQDATALGQEVTCVIPAFDPLKATDPLAWQPVTTAAGLFDPKKGDRALVATQPDGPPLIVWWEPTGKADASLLVVEGSHEAGEGLIVRPDGTLAWVRAPRIPITAWGASVSASATANREACQAAAKTCVEKGAELYVPTGAFTIDATGVQIEGALTVTGDGHGSVLRQAAGVPEKSYLLWAEGPSPSPEANIGAVKLRDLQLRGQCDVDAMNEHVHLVAISAVSDFSAEGVLFRGFRGDALYVAAGLNAPAERHNERIAVFDCDFDGINWQNRNAISVLDATVLAIEGSRFRYCTASSEPGAIDIEPNATTYFRIRAVRIVGNDFFEVGGDSGCIAMDLPTPQAELATPMIGLVIDDNTIRHYKGTGAAVFLRQRQTPGAEEIRNEVTVSRTTTLGGCKCNLEVEGIRGLTQHHNHWGEAEKANAYGYQYAVRDVTSDHDTFYKVGTEEGTAIGLYYAYNVEHHFPRFDSIGKVGSRRLISFNVNASTKAGASSGIVMVDPAVENFTPSAFSALVEGHVTDPTTNIASRARIANAEISGAHFAGGTRTTQAGIEAAEVLHLPADCDTFVVTGAGPIKEIMGGWVGRRVTLRFSAACEVHWGGNLNLNGNFVSTGGGPWQELVLEATGTNGSEWKEIGRVRAENIGSVTIAKETTVEVSHGLNAKPNFVGLGIEGPEGLAGDVHMVERTAEKIKIRNETAQTVTVLWHARV